MCDHLFAVCFYPQADTDDNNVIRRIDIASATVTTVAGNLYAANYEDGVGTRAQFNDPRGVALSANEDFALVVRL
jgi:hypothetical protein